jgi:hypothetical protein
MKFPAIRAVNAMTSKASAPAKEIKLRDQPCSASQRGIAKLSGALAVAEIATATKPYTTMLQPTNLVLRSLITNAPRIADSVFHNV